MSSAIYGDNAADDDTDVDWALPITFCEKRHIERIEGSKTFAQAWRMKERMKTVSVALVICLNVGVDPPDVVKTQPCARLECWIDPLSTSPQKALEGIGSNLQKQYERWQPRARYKQSLDPTVDEVKKLCTSLRRNAKEERVLFHYNGHGVPKPTVNGEIWVFNKSYTQYIPLSVYDLQTWMGTPSIYVYDCSNAGIILKSFKELPNHKEQESSNNSSALSNSQSSVTSMHSTAVKQCIQLASCGPNELLPMNPDLPADLFTACLTTPIKIALKWFVLQNSGRLIPGITQELVDRIPGQLNDRRTMLGELNWIFTAITDTIAWNVLPRDLFQKLFRQDLLVASLFRNFLLAERIMRSYNCTPVSSPNLPSTYHHSMWHAWDLALDLCLGQLTSILKDGAAFKHSPFFAEQLTAFQVWLSYGSMERSPPEQLPIVLQVLLSQVHRLRALDLLGLFLDLGPWAVSLALSVGIFPYVLKLLQSSARELRPLLVFIWAKILAVDSSCQADLVKDNGHKYFLSVLADPFMPAEHRTMAAFVLAMIVNDYPNGQEAAMKGNLIAICLEQLGDSEPLLKQWLSLCLGKVWTSYNAARWCGVRDSAHEKLYSLLNDSEPQVRASTVFALGTFIGNSTERSDHANNIDHNVGMKLVPMVNDGSPLVRMELAVALGGLVQQFETQFAAVAYQFMEEEKIAPSITAVTSGGWNVVSSGSDGSSSGSSGGVQGLKSPISRSSIKTMAYSPLQSYGSSTGSSTDGSSVETTPTSLSIADRIRRISSSAAVASILPKSYGNVYGNVWRVLLQLVMDPYPEVVCLAKAIVNIINIKATMSARPRQMKQSTSSSHSAPCSPSGHTSNLVSIQLGGETPPHVSPSEAVTVRESSSETLPVAKKYQYSMQFARSRKMFDKGPSLMEHKEEVPETCSKLQIMKTEFFAWCCTHFAQSVKRLPVETDHDSASYQERETRFSQNAKVRREAKTEQMRAGFNRLDDEIFINRNPAVPTVIRFHPYESHLAVADKEAVSVWDWEQGIQVHQYQNHNPRHSRITSLEFINAHDQTLLLTGSDDGAVRLWKDYCGSSIDGSQLMTSWQALSDMLPSTRGSGLVTAWEQESKSLVVSGDVRIIRLWDTQTERSLRDIPTGADSCVTSVCTYKSDDRNLLIAGCGDGSVRLYDRRIASPDCRIITLREHTGWVVKVHMQQCTNGKIVSASAAGDVRFWDPRYTDSIHSVNTAHGLTALEVHPYADVIACGSMNQLINVFNKSGDSLSVIKYHEGFMGQRIGAITCMAFHPYKVKLATGSTDSFLSVYSTPENKKLR